MDRKEIAKIIDHTNLNACATESDIQKLCEEAKKYGFASVCVNPSFVNFAYSLLRNSSVKVCTVIGFPLGADTIDNKAASAAVAVDEGASEIDMVVNLGLVKMGEWDDLTEEITAVVDASKSVELLDGRNADSVIVKVILETCYLSDEEIVKCCECAEKAGADFVKTSTGFGTGGATVHAVELMKKTVGDRLKVKASGGIHNYEEALKMIQAGASRIGASAGIKIVED